MSHRITRLALVSAVLLLAQLLAQPFANATSVKDVIQPPTVADIKISPTGEYLAVRIFRESKHSLTFLDSRTLEFLGGMSFSGRREVGNFFWANDERVVAEVFEIPRSQESPVFYGELFAANYDGSRSEMVFGYRSGEKQTGSHIKRKKNAYAWAKLVDVLPDDKRHILISSTPMSASQDKKPVAILLDIYRGVEKDQIKISPNGFGDFYTDGHGDIRLIKSYADNRSLSLQSYPNDDLGWINLSRVNFGKNFKPVAFTEDERSIYVLDDAGEDRVGVYKLSLDGKSYEHVYTHKSVDIAELITSTDGKSVYAARLDNGFPSYLFFSDAHEEAEVFKGLLKTFPGNRLSIRSRSSDGNLWVVQASTDVDSGSYYLFDRKANSIVQLFASRPGVDSNQLAFVEPIEFESFDGQKISGYFTEAKGREGKVSPLVVLVHKGPGNRDYWEYDSEVQALAISGYSVMQINFRGSSGYGARFEQAGNRQWGNEVQKDIIAGTRWAIEQKKAAAGKVCIMGTNFGAYSAVQSAILAPDLFACSVAVDGIYDFDMLAEQDELELLYGGEAYKNRIIGSDPLEWRRYSPVEQIASLKTPIFVAHKKKGQASVLEQDRGLTSDRMAGGSSRIVSRQLPAFLAEGEQILPAPIKQAEKLRAALEKHNKRYEWFSLSRDSKSPYDSENQLEQMQAILRFFDKHIG